MSVIRWRHRCGECAWQERARFQLGIGRAGGEGLAARGLGASDQLRWADQSLHVLAWGEAAATFPGIAIHQIRRQNCSRNGNGRECRRHSATAIPVSMFVSRNSPDLESSLRCASAIGARMRRMGFVGATHADLLADPRPYADQQNTVHYYDNLVVLYRTTLPAGLSFRGRRDQAHRDEELALIDPDRCRNAWRMQSPPVLRRAWWRRP